VPSRTFELTSLEILVPSRVRSGLRASSISRPPLRSSHSFAAFTLRAPQLVDHHFVTGHFVRNPQPLSLRETPLFPAPEPCRQQSTPFPRISTLSAIVLYWHGCTFALLRLLFVAYVARHSLPQHHHGSPVSFFAPTAYDKFTERALATMLAIEPQVD
jgi:hypothetical protein